MVRIGMIGMGLMGSVHCKGILDAQARFENLREDPPTLVACADESPAQLDRAQALYGFERTTSVWREVVDADDIDLVMICSPNWTHAEFAEAACKAGKNIFCEKPVGRSPAETIGLAETAAHAGVLTMVGYVYRWAPMVRYARSLIEAGELGEITHYRGRFLVGYAKDPATPLSWRFDRLSAGFGALGDLMSHVADMSHFLAGRISEVVADNKTFISHRPRPTRTDSSVFGAQAAEDLGEVTNEDYAAALIHLESGGRGLLETCRVISGPVCQMAFDVHGTKGSISWNLERMNELVVTDNVSPDTARTILSGPDYPGQDVFWPGPGVGIGYEDIVTIQAESMTAYMSTGRGDVPTFADAAYVASVQSAIARSWESNTWEKVGPG